MSAKSHHTNRTRFRYWTLAWQAQQNCGAFQFRIGNCFIFLLLICTMWHETFRDFTSYIFRRRVYLFDCCVFFAPPKWPIMWSMSYGYYHYRPSPTLHFVPCALFSPCNFFCSFLLIRLLLWPFLSTPSFYFFLPPLHLKCRTEFSVLTRVWWRQIVNFSLTEQFRYQLLWMIYAINLCVCMVVAAALFTIHLNSMGSLYRRSHESISMCRRGPQKILSYFAVERNAF